MEDKGVNFKDSHLFLGFLKKSLHFALFIKL